MEEKENGARPGHKRMRSLLRNYYGIQDGSEAGQPQENEDPSSIDSRNFEIGKYVEKELRAKNFTQLVSLQTKLAKDVRELDSNMKTLVYENYNKFISATDTIKQMKTNVSEMEGEMDRLAENIKEISDCADTINKTLKPNREAIEKLSGVSSFLQQRQFLFELPGRLKKCIELGSYMQAIKFYNGSKYILDKYSHLPSFNRIRKDSDTIITRLKAILEEKMKITCLLPRDMVEYISCLLEMDPSASSSLRDSYVSWRIKSLNELLNEYSSHPLPMEAPGEQPKEKEKEEEQPENAVDELPSLDLSSSSDSVSSMHSMSSSQTGQSSETPPSAELSENQLKANATERYLHSLNLGFLKEVIEFTESYARLFVEREKSSSASENARAKFDIDTHELFTSYAELVKDKILSLESIEGMIQCLGVIYSDFAAISTNPKKLDMSVRASAVISTCLRAFMVVNYDSCQKKIYDYCNALRKVELQDSNLTKQCDQTSKLISNEIVQFVRSVQDIFRIDPKHFLAHHVNSSYGSLIKFVEQAFQIIGKIGNNFIKQLQLPQIKRKEEEDLNPAFALLLARVAISLEHVGILELEDEMRSVEGMVKLITPLKLVHRFRQMDMRPISVRLGDTSQQLVSSYVREQGTRMSQYIRKGVDSKDWISAQEPRDIRLMAIYIQEEIANICKQVSLIFDSKLTVHKASTATDKSRALSSPLSTHERTINKIFSKKVQIFGGKIEFNVNSISTGIVKIFLKSFSECVRLKTFGKYGYQQIQVDTKFLRMTLVDYSDDPAIINNLLDEVVTSAMSRCFDPVPMEKRIINGIYEKHMQKLRLQQNEPTE